MIFSAIALLSIAIALQACSGEARLKNAQSDTAPMEYLVDGRLPLSSLLQRIDTELVSGWQQEVIYTYADPALAIRSWRTNKTGAALWIIAGLHGEEPAGPNAIARNVAYIKALADSGVPVVLIPVGNPKGYHNNWRYPNTSERDWRKGGYSVGDSEYLLPNLEDSDRPRLAREAGPESKAVTQFALRMVVEYPPALVLDLHEDELSTEGGYIYSQGTLAENNPVGAEIIRLLTAAGIPLRMEGKTRFEESIHAGIISRDDQGKPIRDGSIDELLGSRDVFVNGRKRSGPAARTVIVVETPAFAGAKLNSRVTAHGNVIKNIATLWQLNAALK